mmetsp:Transcript_21810/g.49661  ORF Transcript_21810/g.49661 Transcript_21810/m.49661 type:complete len:240 (-) Transcript_21810:1036-1755(-)
MRLPPSSNRLPSGPYGTSAREAFGHAGAFATRLGAYPKSCKSSRNTSSDLPNNRNVILPSCAVCCKLMQTVPKPPDARVSGISWWPFGSATGVSSQSSSCSSSLSSVDGNARNRTTKAPSCTAVMSPSCAFRLPGGTLRTQAPGAKQPGGGPGGNKDLSAVLVATWSAFKPPKLVPKTRTKSAVSASSLIQGYDRSCNVPLYLTTGFDGSYQLPWISLILSCGNPAFCGKPSWFCCTQP